MNKIVNKILLTGDRFIPKLHLRQPGFTYNACGPFTKHPERNQKFKKVFKVSLIISIITN